MLLRNHHTTDYLPLYHTGRDIYTFSATHTPLTSVLLSSDELLIH